jgi:hypothetical protein
MVLLLVPSQQLDRAPGRLRFAGDIRALDPLGYSQVRYGRTLDETTLLSSKHQKCAVLNIRASSKNASDPLKSFRLRIAYSHSIMSNDGRMQRESNLIGLIRKKLPEFAKACAVDADVVILHQDSFAADYQEDEYTLLGMAIKYAGLRGKEVRVIGKIRSSFAEERIQ